FTNLPAGTNIVTRELTPEQQFDWTGVLNYNGLFAGGFYSVQMTRTDGSDTGVEAGHPLATPGPGAWSNLTRGGGEDVVSVGLIPFRPEFEEVGFPSVGFFINISGFEIAAPAPARIASLQLTTNTAVGGTSLTGTITMTDIVPEDTVIPVYANAVYVQAPVTVTVPAGAHSVSFPITTSASDLNRSIPIQATYAGKTVQQFLVVTPSVSVLTAINLSTNSVRGGTGLRGVITLSGPFGQDRTVTIANSSNSSVVQTPTTVTVPAGAQFASFPITTSAVSRNQPVVIRATFAGKTLEQTLTVTRRR
ncbi:MAG: hypothetical protein H8F28_26170, partial [Fibrella sp.]|nr:hypothetical protein [Armatimonadota bacterium]